MAVSQAKISYSLLREIAMMMEDPVKEVSRCGLSCCVEIEGENGEKETRVLKLGESIPSPRNSCEIYRCEVGPLETLQTLIIYPFIHAFVYRRKESNL